MDGGQVGGVADQPVDPGGHLPLQGPPHLPKAAAQPMVPVHLRLRQRTARTPQNMELFECTEQDVHGVGYTKVASTEANDPEVLSAEGFNERGHMPFMTEDILKYQTICIFDQTVSG